jgi:hypothetical protein
MSARQGRVGSTACDMIDAVLTVQQHAVGCCVLCRQGRASIGRAAPVVPSVCM